MLPDPLLCESAVVLCGGRGNRLRPLTDEVPKPLVEVQGKPILWHTVARLREQGFRRIVLPTGYLGERVRAFAPTLRRDFGVEVQCVETGLDTPIAARLALVAPWIPSGEDYLLVNGDTLFQLDLRALHKHHRETDAAITVASVDVPSRFGLIVERGGRVVDFVRDVDVSRFQIAEENRRSFGYINAGFTWISPEALDDFDLWHCENFETTVFGALSREGRLAHKHLQGFWYCIDTLRDLELANSLQLPLPAGMETV